MTRRRLRLGGRLDRYVGGLFVTSYATAFLLVVGLFLILDMASNLDEYLEPWPDGSRASNLLIAWYYLLDIPFLFLQVAPFVTLVAGLFTVSKLLKMNEVVAALGAGVSSWRLLAPIFLLGALSGVFMFGMREAASGLIAAPRDALRFVLDHKTTDLVYSNLWVRDLNGSAVRLDEFRPSVTIAAASGATEESPPTVRGLEAILRSPTHWSSIQATSAAYLPRGTGKGWKLEGGLHQEVAGSQSNVAVDWLDGFEFTPELAVTYWRARENPLELSFGEVRELSHRNPDDVVYQTLSQYHLTFPLANVVLLLVGIPLLMRRERRKAAEGIAAGAILCVFYFAADFVLRNLGLQGSLDPLFAAWLPVLLFGSLGLVLYDSMRS
jgi:lipopolysaccharide export LptBFGC system permease protein LptF